MIIFDHLPRDSFAGWYRIIIVSEFDIYNGMYKLLILFSNLLGIIVHDFIREKQFGED